MEMKSLSQSFIYLFIVAANLNKTKWSEVFIYIYIYIYNFILFYFIRFFRYLRNIFIAGVRTIDIKEWTSDIHSRQLEEN
jgi:hypothetical protein